ncbi:alpha-keto acid-binding periplasmic protein TakP precursor [Variibacter gotjawalensis]|uniref:Alpha-keto acid-binding periplasmic protein TakP n=1 Tax=Variibacter gotjawalensis TaxID=1333996 RepID=A0A0S3PZ53_9BRAD|nr:TRAP transporter substrate-binding protein DctP [Variibacter gotjawalensis]NIK47000.1 TRAP-type mannitol/chloroaromatic compound transport system substrate-binding protein [Variibacter gotjawalensis]RZS48904.1 TRAP-type mannitol/chloroaromatic compound transport system substrate-binding protein [Variibacter gotjawalensis]BAT61163.1 alpha-keto acid-binding periplasmic protein TakP precursor [Variibacter gotjawalensis]
MKRREFLRTAGVTAAATTIAAPAIAQSMPEIKWRMATSWPKSLDTLYGGAEHFCKRIAEMTDNKFQITPFAAGELVPGLQVLDAVQSGTVEAGNTALYYYWGKDPAMAFGTVVPFGLNTRQTLSWQLAGGGLDLINDMLKDYNCHAVMGGNTGAQMGGWFRKEVKSLDDLKGMKIRIAGLGGTILSRVGAVPQQVAASDIYPALEKGTIDAAEWVGPYDDEKLGFVKVAKYYYYPGWWEGNAQGHTLFNLAKWNELPKSYQHIVNSASHDLWTWVMAKYDIVNAPALKRLVNNGAVLRAFPQDVMESCYKVTNELYAELSKNNKHFAKLHQSMIDYRGDSLAWNQVAELGFDSFMMRMRTRS